jgi:hypothetical protein
MMEAVRTFETLVHFNVATWRCIPEGCRPHSRCRDNLQNSSYSVLPTSLPRLQRHFRSSPNHYPKYVEFTGRDYDRQQLVKKDDVFPF